MADKFQFRRRNIGYIASLADKFETPTPTESYRPHTLLKLICLASYSNQFCSIVHGPSSKARGYTGAVYLDLFAGSGLVSIEGTPDVVGGSPLVACSGGKFDYSILVEIKKQKAEALDERLGVFLPKEKYHVIQGNCNEKVDEIISEIKSKVSKPIILAFVDPEGMEIKFETLKRISSAFPNTDFMINVTAGGDRVGATVRDGNVANLPIFEDYFPKGMAGEILLKMNSGQPVEKQYEDMVKEVLGRPVGVTIPVNDVGERVMYYVMAYTRESYGGSGWKNILEHIRDQLRGVDGVEAGNTLDIIKGRRGTLDPYASSS